MFIYLYISVLYLCIFVCFMFLHFNLKHLGIIKHYFVVKKLNKSKFYSYFDGMSCMNEVLVKIVWKYLFL